MCSCKLLSLSKYFRQIYYKCKKINFILFLIINACVAQTLIQPKADFLNVREKPSKDSFAIGVITKGKDYSVYKMQGEWLQVKCESGRLGWIRKADIIYKNVDTLEKNETKQNLDFVMVDVPLINIREQPDSSAYSLAIAYMGAQLKVIQQQENWLKISFNNVTGWVQKKGVSGLPAYQSAKIKENNNLVKRDQKTIERKILIKPSYVNVKEHPSSEAFSIGVLDKDEELTVYDEMNGWLKIRYMDQFGWIPGSATSAGASETERKMEATKVSKQNIYGKTGTPGQVNLTSYAKWTFLSLGIISSGLAGYYYQKGNDTYAQYQSSTNPNQVVELYDNTITLDKRRNSMYVLSGVNLGFAAIMFYLDSRNPSFKTVEILQPDKFSILCKIHLTL